MDETMADRNLLMRAQIRIFKNSLYFRDLCDSLWNFLKNIKKNGNPVIKNVTGTLLCRLDRQHNI
jgi:hypothetical protein